MKLKYKNELSANILFLLIIGMYFLALVIIPNIYLDMYLKSNIKPTVSKSKIIDGDLSVKKQ